MNLLVTAGLVLAAVLLTTAYFVLKHRRPTTGFKFDLSQLPNIEEGLRLIAGITAGQIYPRNSACIYQNDAIFDAMIADMEAAQCSIHLESFVWTTGTLTRRFIEVMARKVEQGVTVRVLLDAIGDMSSDEEELEEMRQRGIRLAEYRPIKRLDIRRFNNRTHRKLLIVDGCIGYTFGHGISDAWLGQGNDARHWRDTGVRLQGSVVGALQSVFVQDWIETTSHIPTEMESFPHCPDAGEVAAHVVTSTADSNSSVAQLYQLAIASARSEIIIQNPYFSPEPQVPNLLADIARKGVRVHLMVPGRHTDAPVVRRAGHWLYEVMLRAGVKIYEYEPTLLHQKIVIIDGKWSHIGSTNFDERSLALNAEIGVGMLSETVAQELKEAFLRDLKLSRELNLEDWMQRPWYKRMAEWCAYQAHQQL